MFLSRAASLIAPQTVQGVLTSAPVELASLQRHGFVVVNSNPTEGQVAAKLEQSADDETWTDVGHGETLVSGIAVLDYSLVPAQRASSQTLYLRCTLKATAGKHVTASAVVVPVAQSAPVYRK